VLLHFCRTFVNIWIPVRDEQFHEFSCGSSLLQSWLELLLLCCATANWITLAGLNIIPPRAGNWRNTAKRKEFIINEYLTVRLEGTETVIYVAGNPIRQYKALCLGIPRSILWNSVLMFKICSSTSQGYWNVTGNELKPTTLIMVFIN